MDILKKIELINEFAAQYLDSPEQDFQIFFRINNLGVPFCIGITNGYISLNNQGHFIIEETWVNMCEFFDIDPEDEYEDFYDLIDSSDFGLEY